MKSCVRFSIVASLFISTQALALSPIDGFYGGILAELSHGPSGRTAIFEQDGQVFSGQVDYSPLSGGGGAFLGYQYKNFRVEGEVVFNRISAGPVTVGSCTIQSPNVVTPTGICTAGIYDDFDDNALGYSGNSAALYGLINASWQFFAADGNNDLVPYVGAGAGLVQVKNGDNFIQTANYYSSGGITKYTGIAYQGIVGFNYYIDDFTWVSMDYRYLLASLNSPTTTITTSAFTTSTGTYGLQTLNFTVGFSFDKGAMD